MMALRISKIYVLVAKLSLWKLWGQWCIVSYHFVIALEQHVRSGNRWITESNKEQVFISNPACNCNITHSKPFYKHISNHTGPMHTFIIKKQSSMHLTNGNLTHNVKWHNKNSIR
jgi:hypothetical protein